MIETFNINLESPDGKVPEWQAGFEKIQSLQAADMWQLYSVLDGVEVDGEDVGDLVRAPNDSHPDLWLALSPVKKLLTADLEALRVHYEKGEPLSFEASYDPECYDPRPQNTYEGICRLDVFAIPENIGFKFV
jgi:hypothetical protein